MKKWKYIYLVFFLSMAQIGKSQLVPFKDTSNNLYGYKDSIGSIIIQPQYTMANKFSDGRAAVNKGAIVQFQNVNGGKWGFIDSVGTLVIPLEYDFVQPFKKGIARVIKNHKSFPIDKSGKYIDETKVYYLLRENTPINWDK